MFKNYLFIFLFFFLINCSAPGSALLGPAFTGATTKSVTQASLSFGTNQIARKVHEASKKTKDKINFVTNEIEKFSKNPSFDSLLISDK